MSKGKFSFFGKNIPAIDWESVTPSDSTDFTRTPRAIFVGGAGNIVAVSHEGNEVTFNSLAAGETLYIQPKRINATNTTATNLVALY